MIKDKLKNATTYFGISESLKKGFEWLIKTDLEKIECGKYEILGEKIYASVQEYETKLDAKYESHRKYIDIQYLIYGTELVGITNLSNCKSCIEYDEQKDLEFFDIITKDEYLDLSKEHFLVLFPWDAHKPSIANGKQSIVKKVVVKVAID